MAVRIRAAVVSQLAAISISLGLLASGCGSSTESRGAPDAEADVAEGSAPADGHVGEAGPPADGHPDDTRVDGVDRADSASSNADAALDSARFDAALDAGLDAARVDAGLDAARVDAPARDVGSDAGSTPPSDASTDGGGNLCSTLGWCEIANTKLESVCPRPLPGGTTGCSSVIVAWSGAAADIDNHQLYIWGGGHNDYHGNEVYALDLVALRMKRLNEPSAASAVLDCSDQYADGLPSSRHTYDALTFLPGEKALFAFGGSKAKCGSLANDTWTFSPASLTWTARKQGGPPSGSPGVMTDFDAASNRVLLHDTAAFWSFDPATNAYQRLRDSVNVDYHMTGRIDPKRQVFVMMGGGQLRAISIAAGSSYDLMNWDSAATGCDVLRMAPSPGLTYDPAQDRLVGWAGGDDVYLFDADAKNCTKASFPGGPGPKGPAVSGQGTFGRFRYFPKLGVFVVVSDWQSNAFSLRMVP
jgi:hypothetical protein